MKNDIFSQVYQIAYSKGGRVNDRGITSKPGILFLVVLPKKEQHTAYTVYVTDCLDDEATRSQLLKYVTNVDNLGIMNDWGIKSLRTTHDRLFAPTN